MIIEIPDNIVESSECNEQEFIEILALALYQREKISTRQAADFVGVKFHEFGEIMKRYDVDTLYDEDDLESDLKTLRNIDSMKGNK
jgi:predicted HTH domain antitoxin